MDVASLSERKIKEKVTYKHITFVLLDFAIVSTKLETLSLYLCSCRALGPCVILQTFHFCKL